MPEKSEFFSVKGVFTTRSCVFMGLMAAIAVVLGLFGTIHITPTFRAVSIAYIPGAVVAMLLGPWAALAFGFVVDIVKFIVAPQGSFFPGYTLSEMLHYFILACFFYKQPINIWRCLISRLIVVIVVFFGLGFTWQNIMFGTASASFFTSTRLINNLVQWPFHSVLMLIVCKQVLKIKPRM